MAILVDLRVWEQRWNGKKLSLVLKGNNVAALALVLRTKATPGAMKAIAKDIAMVLTRSTHIPREAQHIPGVTHTRPV